MDEPVTLVCGGASGIGLEVVREMAARGPVVVADVAKAGESLLKGESIHWREVDVTLDADWQTLADDIATRFGRLDYVVFAAGIAPIAPLVDSTPATIDRVLDVNVASIMIGVRQLWSLLTTSQSAVVLVASVAGLVGQNSSAAYVASKGAVIALTRALAIELAPFGVRVNCVSPGPTDTPMIQRHFSSLADGERSRKQLEHRMPIGRLLNTREVAVPIAHWLLSEHSTGMTGSNLVIDGGLTATFSYGDEFSGGTARD